MTASRRVLDKKNSAYADNIHKRGEVPASLVVDNEKRANTLGISPFTVGLLVFVVIGSSLAGFLASLMGGSGSVTEEV